MQMPTEQHPIVEKYDVILVGAGATGCVLANRLSTDRAYSVLLLEAGPNANADARVRTPGKSRALFNDPQLDWQFMTDVEPGLNGRQLLQHRGRLIGGSSAINSHTLAHSSRALHDAWAALGNPDWDWAGTERYYRRFQNLQQPSKDVREQLALDCYGLESAGPSTGLVKASFPGTVHPLQRAWIDCLQDPKDRKDPASGDAIGGFTVPNAIDAATGERSHAGSAYLEPVLHRPNLTVKTGAQVSRIEFAPAVDNEPLKALGVTYVQDGQTNRAHANVEVVLCAGVFGSPQILELSGIGSRDRLAGCNLDCLLDLPGVGENLQDHLNYGPSIEVKEEIETHDVAARDPAVAAARQQLYDSQKRGALAEGAYSWSYLPLQINSSWTSSDQDRLIEVVSDLLHSSDSSQRPAAVLDFIRTAILSPKEATATVFLTRKQRYTPPTAPAPGNYMTILAMFSHPLSRGSSHIATADPTKPPTIKFNYLSHPLDLEVFARHALQLESLFEHPALAKCIKPNGRRLPAEFASPLRNLEDAKAALRERAATNYHPCGTCAMMPRVDGGVVDQKLRVWGTSNVRVVDASVFPIIPRANILSAVYAVAEKAADIFAAERDVQPREKET